jgi:hypothetical protein
MDDSVPGGGPPTSMEDEDTSGDFSNSNSETDASVPVLAEVKLPNRARKCSRL